MDVLGQRVCAGWCAGLRVNGEMGGGEEGVLPCRRATRRRDGCAHGGGPREGDGYGFKASMPERRALPRGGCAAGVLGCATRSLTEEGVLEMGEEWLSLVGRWCVAT